MCKTEPDLYPDPHKEKPLCLACGWSAVMWFYAFFFLLFFPEHFVLQHAVFSQRSATTINLQLPPCGCRGLELYMWAPESLIIRERSGGQGWGWGTLEIVTNIRPADVFVSELCDLTSDYTAMSHHSKNNTTTPPDLEFMIQSLQDFAIVELNEKSSQRCNGRRNSSIINWSMWHKIY